MNEPLVDVMKKVEDPEEVYRESTEGIIGMGQSDDSSSSSSSSSASGQKNLAYVHYTSKTMDEAVKSSFFATCVNMVNSIIGEGAILLLLRVSTTRRFLT